MGGEKGMKIEPEPTRRLRSETSVKREVSWGKMRAENRAGNEQKRRAAEERFPQAPSAEKWRRVRETG
ncbi:hypothetical protein NDU88_003030 [Pleurodeles waltl]|uniref:Uncharacterized protein n=1 Tax=Pleurodeles waltl TaxID=8319 RepID=A0AAV7W446_PLEWA|nr:hypothetical protein NDU88_003030 [Pleurodeles waltl]